MGLHRRDAHEELRRDLGGPPPFADELEHLALARAEQRAILARLHQPGGEQPGHRRREVALIPGDGIDRVLELVAGRLLEDVPRGTGGQRLAHDRFLGVHRQEEDARPAIALPDDAGGIDPVQVGHGDVRHHQIGLERVDLAEQRPAVSRFRDDLDRAVALEELPQPRTDDRMIVRHDDAQPHAARHLRLRECGQ